MLPKHGWRTISTWADEAGEKLVLGKDGLTTHRLVTVLEGAARGVFPAPDGRVEVLGPPTGPAMAVVAFTGHHIVAACAPEPWVREQLPDGDFLAPMSPRFLAALGRELGRRDDGVDVLLAAEGLAGDAHLTETARDAHPRVLGANAHRDGVRVFEDATGTAVFILGRGLAGRLEVAFEVDEAERCRGVARRALREARRLAGPDRVLFAQTAPGNAASLRALLAAGFRPIARVLFFGQS